MNGSLPTPPDTGHETSRDSPPTFSVVEVAAILGISKDAVRARLHRGTLEGVKVEGAWRVRLPDDVSLDTLTSHKVSKDQPFLDDVVSFDTKVGRQPPTPDATAPTSSATPTPTPPQSDAMIAHLEHLEGEVQYLREQLAGALDALAEERRRADVLRLGASVSPPETSQDTRQASGTEEPAGGILRALKRWLTGER